MNARMRVYVCACALPDIASVHVFIPLCVCVSHTSSQFYLLLDGHLQAERQVTVQGTHTQAPTSRTPSSASRGAHTHSGGGLDGIGGANTEGGAGHITEIGIIRPGRAISCAAFLSYTQARCRCVCVCVHHARVCFRATPRFRPTSAISLCIGSMYVCVCMCV